MNERTASQDVSRTAIQAVDGSGVFFYFWYAFVEEAD